MTYNYTARESFVEVQSLAVGDSAPCYRHFPHGKYDHPYAAGCFEPPPPPPPPALFYRNADGLALA